MEREGITGLPRGITQGGHPQSWRLTKPGEETCDTGTCPKCGAIYERLRHFDYCPMCDPAGPNGIEYPGADLIRSRDKAIIERCKEVLQEMRENGDHDMRQAICRVDLILRDLS